MEFQNLTPESPFIQPDGSMLPYETMTSLSSGSSPRPRGLSRVDRGSERRTRRQDTANLYEQDFEYTSLMGNTPISIASSYGLAVPAVAAVQQPLSPDPSPVDHVHVEFIDLAAPYPEDRSYKPRKQDGKAQPSTSMHMRRRAQNRASQRAFRERKEKHTQELQRRLTEVEHQFDCLKQQYEQCQREKGELEVQARRCSCTGLEGLSSASECGSPVTDASTSASLTSGSSSNSSAGVQRIPAVAASAVGASPQQEPLTLGIPAGMSAIGGIHDLDAVYWNNRC